MNIDSEIILQRKVSPIIYVYIMIIIVITLSLIILIMLGNYKTYYHTRGTLIVEDNHYYIKISIPYENIKYLLRNSQVFINQKNYNYQINSISEEYYTDNINTYQIVKIKVNLEEKYRISNLTFDLKFPKEEKKIIDFLIPNMRKGGI